FKNPPNNLSFGGTQVGSLAILDKADNSLVGGPFTCLYPSITSGYWTTLTLDDPVALAAATEYKYVFTLIGPIIENLRCYGDRSAAYTGGQMMTPAYEAGTFPVITTLYTAGRDMYFVLQEYVDTGVNSEPFVDAGSDAAIYLQSYRDGGNIVIDASSADDGNILPLTYDWSVIGDDTNVSFVAIDVEDPNVTFSALGSYELQLEAYDGELDDYDTVVITVIDNSAPIVGAGADKLLYLTEGDSVVLSDAFVTDDGEPNLAGSYTLTTTWAAVPETGISFDPYLINTTATFTETGTYVLTLTADDTEFAPFDAVTVTVKDKMLDSLESMPTDDSYVDELEPELTHGGLNRFRITALEGQRNYYYAKFDVSDYDG
ncbi:MAG: hypothetical protein KAR47_21775, partial [Planctomycetes bacterium]|nr:hypothetical protein [Planctomycetota bacterium]